MKRVIGLGGPFIKAKDPKAMAAWYQKHLGINFKGLDYTEFPPADEEGKAIPGYNIMAFFKDDTTYFDPSEKQVMVNFRVHDVFALKEQLIAEGVTVVGEPMDEEYGKFIWILDPEGNKVELWEPPAR